MKTLSRLAFMTAVAAVTLWSFLVEDAQGFLRPELARIFFWHFPCPILATVLLIIGAYFSVQTLRTGSRAMDVRAVAANELAMVFILLTLTTGIIFSGAQWNAFWQRDPRQTSFLLVTLVYAAYFVLRGALPDPVRRMRQSAAYAVFAFAPAMFLTYIFPRLPQIAQSSFHPTQSIMSGSIKGSYAYIVIAVMVLVAVMAVWCYRLRVRVGLLELEREDSHGQLETHRRDPADPRVVRPVRLPQSGRP